MRVRTWDSLLQAIFCKNRLRGISLWANLYQKLPISAILGVVSPHFKSDNGEIWPETMDLRYPPPAIIFVKIAHGDLSLGKFLTKIKIFAIFSFLNPYFYTDNVKILLTRTDGLRNPSKKQIFVKIAEEACRYCIARRSWCISISSLWYFITQFFLTIRHKFR